MLPTIQSQFYLNSGLTSAFRRVLITREITFWDIRTKFQPFGPTSYSPNIRAQTLSLSCETRRSSLETQRKELQNYKFTFNPWSPPNFINPTVLNFLNCASPQPWKKKRNQANQDAEKAAGCPIISWRAAPRKINSIRREPSEREGSASGTRIRAQMDSTMGAGGGGVCIYRSTRERESESEFAGLMRISATRNNSGHVSAHKFAKGTRGSEVYSV